MREIVDTSFRGHVHPHQTGGILIFMFAWTLGCGGSADNSQERAASAEARSIDLDACELLGATDAAEILGGEVGEPTRGIQSAGDERNAAMSSCSYEGPSGRSVNLMVRHSPTQDNTPSAIGTVREGSAALGELEDVTGVGDTAFAVRFSGENSVQLHVFWGGDRYQMVTVQGFEHEEGIERAKTVARLVMDRL